MPVRRILVVFAIALAVAWAGYTAYWFHAEGLLRKGLERWAEQRRGDGWQVEWSDMRTGGYPAHLRLTLATPLLVSPGGLTWQAASLTGDADPLDWTRLHLEAAGEHGLAWPGGDMRLSAATARADVNIAPDGALQDATLLLAGLNAEGSSVAPFSVEGLAVTWDPLPPLPAEAAQPDHTRATVRFSLTGHGIHLPPLPDLPLDRDVALAEITGRVTGTLPPGPPAQSLAAWAADGGTVEIEHLSLEWDPMALEGDGTLALDPSGQPLAAMSTRVRGFAPLMDRLAEARTIDARAAQAAKIVLMLMAKPDAKGRPAVPVPINIQDGVVSLGPAAVARLPAIQW